MNKELIEKLRALIDKNTNPSFENPNFRLLITLEFAREILAGLERLDKLESLIVKLKDARDILADAPKWKPAQERVEDSIKRIIEF